LGTREGGVVDLPGANISRYNPVEDFGQKTLGEPVAPGAPGVLPSDGFSRGRDKGRAPCNEEGEADGESDPTTPR